MELKQAKNDQQATNAALAALAATGNTFALGQLWEVNKGFIRRQLWQWFEKNKPVADNAGLSFEDLVQEGLFCSRLCRQALQRRTGQFHNVSELRTVEADSHRHLWRAHTCGCNRERQARGCICKPAERVQQP